MLFHYHNSSSVKSITNLYNTKNIGENVAQQLLYKNSESLSRYAIDIR